MNIHQLKTFISKKDEWHVEAPTKTLFEGWREGKTINIGKTEAILTHSSGIELHHKILWTHDGQRFQTWVEKHEREWIALDENKANFEFDSDDIADAGATNLLGDIYDCIKKMTNPVW